MEDTQAPNKRKILIPIVIILVVIVGALLAIKASVPKKQSSGQPQIDLNEGATAPDFEMMTLEGKAVSFSSLPHKVVMINFWATWCEACIEEMPSIVQLRETYHDAGFEVLGINVDENAPQVVPGMAKKFGMNFPIFTDAEGELASLFDVHAIPLTVFMNSKREILLVESGERDWNAEQVQQMLKNWLEH